MNMYNNHWKNWEGWERWEGVKPLEQPPCLHDSCPSCNGSGSQKDGQVCIHAISCPCPKCSPMC